MDDVLNVSGHRMGSAEIESALVANSKVAEAAVIGFPHDVKGEGEGETRRPDAARSAATYNPSPQHSLTDVCVTFFSRPTQAFAAT